MMEKGNVYLLNKYVNLKPYCSRAAWWKISTNLDEEKPKKWLFIYYKWKTDKWYDLIWKSHVICASTQNERSSCCVSIYQVNLRCMTNILNRNERKGKSSIGWESSSNVKSSEQYIHVGHGGISISSVKAVNHRHLTSISSMKISRFNRFWRH